MCREGEGDTVGRVGKNSETGGRRQNRSRREWMKELERVIADKNNSKGETGIIETGVFCKNVHRSKAFRLFFSF